MAPSIAGLSPFGLSLQWALAYQALDTILGNGYTQLAFGDPQFGLHTSPTVQGRRKHADGLAPIWTFPIAPSAFTVPFDPNKESCYQGIIPFFDFQGVNNERATTPDHDSWTPSLTPFSYAAWVKLPINLTTATLLYARSDQTVGAVKTEVEIYINSDETFHAILYAANDLNRRKNRSSNTPLALGVWHHLIVVYDGTTQAGCLKLYLNGVQVDDTSEDAGDFSGGVSNTTELTRLGHVISASGTVTGKAQYQLAGGPNGQLYERNAVWTQAQIENLYRFQRSLAGV